MTDWATEFAHEILESEARTKETWSAITELLRKAVAEINSALEGKSQTKLSLGESAEMLTLDSNLGLKASFNLGSHARTLSFVMDRTTYNFQLTKEPDKLISTSTPLLPGATGNAPIDLTMIVSYAVKAVVDLRG
jgi:hypothetical protein